MRNFTLFKMSVALVFLSIPSLHSQTFVINKSVENVWIHFSDLVPPSSLSGTSSAIIELNNQDLSVTIPSWTYNISGTNNFSRTYTRIETIGGGFGGTTFVTNLTTIEGMIEFDATLQFVDDRTLQTMLVDFQPNRFRIQNFFNHVYGRSDQTLITGNYSFSGPTESTNGTFSINPFFRARGRPVLDTSGYPGEVDFTRSPFDSGFTYGFDAYGFGSGYSSIDDRIFRGRIDGIDMDVQFVHINNQQIVPEPSEYALMMGLGLLGFVMFRRVKFA